MLRSAPASDADLLMQLRAERSHHGGTWGVLGGARDAHESAVVTAVREAGEEATVDAHQLRVEASWVDDHGGWSYTTVVASAVGHIDPAPRNWESDAVRWIADAQVDDLPLHHGFARTWPLLRTVGAAPVLVVDAANTIGSRPDGWWKDRAGAVTRLRDALAAAAVDGFARDVLLPTTAGLADVTVFPDVVLVSEGAARDVGTVPGVEVTAASGSGDDRIVEAVAERVPGPRPVVVVTADRELADRVRALGASVIGPRTLLDQLS